VIAVEPAGLVELAHAVHVPPTTLGAPQESAAHEHAVIAVEPARLTALLPQETHVPPTTLGAPQEFAAHEHAVIAVEPARLTALLPQETHVGDAVPASFFHAFAPQSEVGRMQRNDPGSQIVPTPQSAEETGQSFAGSSPLATQQQRRE
jgi:hypothetical protein